jgi:hypothetical protein
MQSSTHSCTCWRTTSWRQHASRSWSSASADTGVAAVRGHSRSGSRRPHCGRLAPQRMPPAPTSMHTRALAFSSHPFPGSTSSTSPRCWRLRCPTTRRTSSRASSNCARSRAPSGSGLHLSRRAARRCPGRRWCSDAPTTRCATVLCVCDGGTSHSHSQCSPKLAGACHSLAPCRASRPHRPCCSTPCAQPLTSQPASSAFHPGRPEVCHSNSRGPGVWTPPQPHLPVVLRRHGLRARRGRPAGAGPACWRRSGAAGQKACARRDMWKRACLRRQDNCYSRPRDPRCPPLVSLKASDWPPSCSHP